MLSDAMRRAAFLLATAFLGVTLGCRPSAVPVAAVPARPTTTVDLERYAPHPIGRPFEGKPWITHVNVVDLDRDGRQDVLACDASLNAVAWLRQTGSGEFAESTHMAGLSAPVHVESADIDGDGDLDLLVACMGELLPNNDQIGSIVVLENDGAQHFTKHVIAERIARVTDVRAADFDGDGRLDLAVGQFGYTQGEIRWMRNLGGWRFESKILLSLSGTINVCVTDLNGDHTPDIVALVSQQWEEIHLFENDGKGNFTSRIIFGSTNEDFGSSSLSVCDLNRASVRGTACSGWRTSVEAIFVITGSATCRAPTRRSAWISKVAASWMSCASALTTTGANPERPRWSSSATTGAWASPCRCWPMPQSNWSRAPPATSMVPAAPRSSRVDSTPTRPSIA
jgi:hypothetical protein